MKLYPLALLLIIWALVSGACNFPRWNYYAGETPPDSTPETLSTGLVSSTREPTGQVNISDGESPSADETESTPESASSYFPLNSTQDDTASTFTYYVQSGDSLIYLTERFEMHVGQITSDYALPADGLLPPGQLLSIPNTVGEMLYTQPLLPDSEVIYSPSTVDFSVDEYINNAGGYLGKYREHVYDEWLTGAQIIERIAIESSVNPRLLLAFLEFRSGWVLGEPDAPIDKDYPIGFHVSGKHGLYQELVMAATHLNKGYYGGRGGIVKELKFQDGDRSRIHPELNAGSMGIQYLFSLFYNRIRWQEALYNPYGFIEMYQSMFPGVWERASKVEPLLPAELAQPDLELPFNEGERWSLTGGPHYSWNAGSPRGALDFAPVTGEPACEVSKSWVTAMAPGFVTRSAYNVLVIDLDGDDFEGTGWSVLYLHLADQERTPSGTWVDLDDNLGHPSCERGHNTGTHVHIARKYNGEWLPIEGSVPFVLSGWEVQAGEKNYQGEMHKGEQVVRANSSGPGTSIIIR